MRYSYLKRIAKTLGVYRHVRWVNLHLFRREALRISKSMESFYSTLIGEGDLVFDVGANVGSMTDVFLRIGARVIAFEPQPECRRELEDRIRSSNRLQVCGLALGANDGVGALHLDPAHTGTASFHTDWSPKFQHSIQVDICTLDSMIQKYGVPRYIKIDVEGFELQVLKGLSAKIPLISFESHRDHHDDILKTRACIEYLETLGSIRLNFTPAETPTFVLSEWMSPEQFLQVYPADYSDAFEYRYGDIFARTDA